MTAGKKRTLLLLPFILLLLIPLWRPLKNLHTEHVEESFTEVPWGWQEKWYCTNADRRGYFELTANELIRYDEAEDLIGTLEIEEVVLHKFGGHSLDIITKNGGDYWIILMEPNSLAKFGYYRDDEDGRPRKADSQIYTTQTYN